MSKQAFKLIVKMHRALGLFLGLNFLVLAFTGTILIWKDELTSDIDSNIQVEQRNYNKIDSILKKQFPDKKILAVFPDDHDQRITKARITDIDSAKFRGAQKITFINNLLSNELPQKKTGFINTLLELHRELLLGSKGKYLVGIMGLLILFLVISGLIYVTKMKFKKQKLNNKLIHSQVGKIISGWLFLVTVTGIMLSFNGPIINLYIQSQLTSQQTKSSTHQTYKDFSFIEQTITSSGTNIEVDFISYPNHEFSLPDTFVILVNKENKKAMLFIDAVSAQLIKTTYLPWYLNFLIASESLHFGNYGGVGLKIIWTILSILSTIIPITGTLIYINRKRSFKIEFIKKLDLIKVGKTFHGFFLPLSCIILAYLYPLGVYPVIVILMIYLVKEFKNIRISNDEL